MSFLDKMKDMLNVSEEDYYDDVDSGSVNNGYAPTDEPEELPARRVRHTVKDSRDNADKVVNIHATAQLQVILAKPEKFEDAKDIADNLNEKRTVVLNLESANRDVARRLIDFLSGVAYANEGQLKRVANSTFIITPYNVDVMGDLLDELENNGMFF